MAKQRSSAQVKKATPVVPQQSYALPLTIALGILVIGVVRVLNYQWVSDDAFITFRYVQHFVGGEGIVYNVGEHVEGYTHFLWLLILSGAQWLGANPVKASTTLGMFFYVMTLVIFLRISAKEQLRRESKRSLFSYLPVAAILLALNPDMNIWATGGLETSLFAFLISITFYTWFYSSLHERTKALIISVLFLLLALTRPDGALFAITAVSLFAAWSIKTKRPLASTLKTVALFLSATIVIGIPYLLWKQSYYGDIFPTTYYAKSAGQSYFDQGFFYIFLFFRVYFGLAVAFIGMLIVAALHFKRSRGIPAAADPSSATGSPVIAAVAVVLVYLVGYVANVGGDFMFARFIIPILPLLCYLSERFIDSLSDYAKHYRLAAAVVLVALTFAEAAARRSVLFHTDEATGELAGNWDDNTGGQTRGIADEHWVYTRPRFVYNDIPMSSIETYSDIGKFYEPFFRGLPVSVVVIGAQNSIAYYANFQTCINDYGLTDSTIAHQQITQRGRVGHEKRGTEEYYQKRGVHFQMFAVTGTIPERGAYDMAVFPTHQNGVYQLAKIITYDSAIINELSRRFLAQGIRAMIPRLDILIPDYIANVMPNTPPFMVAEDYTMFKRLYFDKYPDPESEQRILAFLSQHKDSARR